MKRIFLRMLLALAGVAILFYAGDWGVFQVRGKPAGVVEVNQLLATPLKGNKVEYDFMGVLVVTCSRSIFPRNGNSACWWVERHKTQWE